MASAITHKSAIRGSLNGAPSDAVVAETATFAFDATPSAMPVYTTEKLQGGHLSGVGVVFGPVTLPDSITATIKDSLGVTIAAGTLTATGRLTSFTPQPFVGALTVTLAGNTTASAVGSVTLYAV